MDVKEKRKTLEGRASEFDFIKKNGKMEAEKLNNPCIRISRLQEFTILNDYFLLSQKNPNSSKTEGVV